MEVDQRQFVQHCVSEAHVVTVLNVCASVAIAQQSVRPERIAIWTFRCRCNRKRPVSKQSGLENSLRSEKWDSLALKLKAFDEQFARQHIAVPRNLFFEPIECARSDTRVLSGRGHHLG